MTASTKATYLYKVYDQLKQKGTLGNTNYTIRDYGCTTCVICSGLFKFGITLNPEDASKIFEYTSEGLLLWQSVEKIKDIKFIKRVREYNEAAGKEIAEVTQNPSKFAIVEVKRAGWTTRHWLLITNSYSSNFSIIDPWGGKVLDKVPISDTIVGYTIFEFKPEVSDWAKESWEKYKGIFNNPKQELDILDIENDLLNMKVVSKAEGNITAERWAVIKQRLKS